MKSKNQIIKWLFFTIFLLLTFFYFQPVLAVEPDLGLDEVASQTGLGGGDLRVMVGSIIKVSLGFLGVVALLLVLYGGYLYMTSGGQEEKIGKAKKVLISAIIGLALIFSAYAITAFVFKSLGIAINGGDDDSGGSGPVIISGGNGSLYVNSITPAGNVPIRNVKVKINFSKPVNSGTVTTENISIYKKSSSQKIVSFGEALSVSEANNNSSILASIINDDGVATQNWLVCGADFDGASPMDVELDNANKGDAEKTFLIIKGNKSTNASSADKTFSITCKASGSEQVYDIIDKQVLLDGENVFALPALCATSDRVIVTVIGTGNACLNLDYVALKYEKTQVEEQNILVEGNLEVNGFYRNLVTFVPSAFCGDDHPDLHCFDANSSYEVKIKEDAVRSITGDLAVNCSLGSNCIGNFSTGDLVDTASPVANFVQPAPNAKVSVDRLTDVVINGSDDSGISNIEFFVDEVSEGFSAVSSGLNQKDYIGNFSWDTEGLEFKRYQLKGIANDIDSNSGEKTISVSVLPARCFDSNGNILCDNDGSRPECGRCDGSSCNNDDDCAGICVKTCNGEGVLTCIDDTVCEEGTSCLGVCETVPIITDFAPKKAGVGALVTVAGSGFGNFVSNISKVYFSDGNGGYLPAQIGCNDNYNWSQSNVVVKVPSGAVTGPIKIVTGSQKVDTTDNDDGGILADFVVDNSVQFPSLCSVRTTDCTPACIGSICNKCDNGIINDNVLGAGENFGATKNDDAGMFFGSIPGLFVQGFNWTNTLVSNVGIPNIAKQRHDVFVSTGEICQSGDGQECTPPSADCECEVINSNPVPFYVVDGNNEPTIERLDPSVGPVGQYVTVYGKNFGADVGYVTIEREVDGVPFEWVMVTNCGDKAWTANQLVVKVPEKIKVQLSSSGEDFYLGNNYKIKVYNSAGIVSNSVDFEINNEVPTPGLCAIDPSAGPVGVKVDLIGENFGIQEGSFDLYFSQNGGTVLDCPSGITPCTPGENLCSCTWKNDQGTDVVEINSWTNELLSGVTVPAGTVSGGVFFRDDNGRTSNAVNFTVGSCSANSCSDGRNCCSDGACRINCQDEVEYLPSEYMWLVSTGPLPITPSVLERTCLTGYYPQSPSPAKDSEDACPNGLISATFNMLMGPNGNIPPYDSNTFQGNVVIKRCLSTGTKCNFTNCNETGVGGCLQKTVNAVALNDIGKTGLSYNCQKNGNPCDPNNTEGCSCNTSAEISTFALNSSITDSLNDLVGVTGNPNIFENVNNKIGLYKNSWYEVTIKGGDGGVGTGKLGATLPKDYSWQFKTKNQDCQPTDLLLTPLVGLISDLEDKEKYNIAGQYQCQTISLRNENWQWNFIQSTEKAQFAGYACLADEPMVCAEPTQRRNDVGVFEIKSNVDVTFDYETLPGQPLEISATAEPIDEDLAEIFEQMFKKGFLNINFSDPRVINFYPDCIEACINSEIGVNFNIRMSANSFVPNQSIKLFSCSSSACTALTPITLADDEVNFAHVDASAISESKNLLSLHLNNNLLPNKYYRLVVSDEVKSSSGVNLIGLNYLSGSVSGGDCGDGFDNDADSAVDFTGGYKRADSAGALTYICGCYVNEDEHFVGYSEIGTTCASNEVFACFRTDNPQSLLTEDGALTVIADENIYYEPDQQCQSSSGFEMGDEGIFDSFSFVFKTKNDSTPCAINSVLVEPYNYVSETMAEKIEYWTVPMSSPDSCSVGGQRLNPFEYDWQWNSSDDVVATISNNLILQNGSASCNEK
ncbi:MAG: Ig-like domain-containing protein, partial [Patescibacteria group bacterium]